MPMVMRAMAGAMGPLARVPAPTKKYKSKSQNLLPVSYQAYQPSMPMQSGAASCMSVEAPRENPMTAAAERVRSAA